MTTETRRFTTVRQRLAAVGPFVFGASCRQVVLAGILGVMVIAVVGCGSDDASEDLSTTLTHTISRGDLSVMVTEQGMLESSSNKEIKCKVRGQATVLWVIETGTDVKPGDELVKLDSSTIEDNISTKKISYQTAMATYAQSESDVQVAEIDIQEYIEGTYASELKTKQKDVAIAKSNLRSAENILEHSQDMFTKGYVSTLEVEGNTFSLQRANLELEVANTQLDALQRFTKEKTLTDLRGKLKAKQAKMKSDKANLDLEKSKLDREEKQLENCVITADSSGMVIFPSMADWKSTPDVEEGATVREDQVLLQIPDLRQMQVKVGVHEAYVDRLKPGMRARVTLLAETIEAEVSTIASIARRSGWWTGNMVKYDTVIKIDAGEDSTYRPGMSASVDIILAEHVDVLTIPVAAVVETNGVYHCWVKEGNQTQKRVLDVGDSDDEFMVVKTGVKAGDKVVLNPRAYIEEAQREGLEPTGSAEEKSAADKPKKPQGDKPKKPQGDKPKKPQGDKPKPKKPSKP